MAEHDAGKWVEIYQAAVLELKQSLMTGRIADARAEIVKRIEALRDIPGPHEEERQAIEGASTTFSLWSASRRDNGRRRAQKNSSSTRTLACDCAENQTH